MACRPTRRLDDHQSRTDLQHRELRAALFVTATFLLGIWLLPAAAQMLGPEFQVNSYTTDDQGGPAVAADGVGGFVVVWQSNGHQDGSYQGVFGQRFDSVGIPLGGEFQVNTFTTDHQSGPAVAAYGVGDFVVVWTSLFGQDGSFPGVFGQWFDSDGLPAGAELQVNTYTTSYQILPAVAAGSAGNVVVVWQSFYQDGSGFGVFAQRFDSAGLPVETEFQVNTYTTGDQHACSVAVDGGGGFVVVWSGESQDGSNDDVFGQRFDAVGLPEGPEFQVNSYTTGNQLYPAVAVDDSGNFIVVWASPGQDGSLNGVFGQRFDATGLPVGSEFQANSYTTSNQQYPAVAADDSGSFLVVWESFGQDGSTQGVFGQGFGADGLPVGGEFRVNSQWASRQRVPALAASGPEDFVVVWSSYLQDGPSWGVFGRQASIQIFSDGFDSGDTCAWSVVVGGGGCP